MPWFKTTDTLMTDAKVMMMPTSERGMALGTWVACGTWSTQHLTDGKVPSGIVESFIGTLDGAETLVRAGMWKSTKTGYVFVNWAKYQPTRREVEEKREEERLRVAQWRKNRKGASSQVKAETVTTYEQERTDRVQPSRPDPSRPVPSRSTGSSNRGGLPKQADGTNAPQPCGRDHDPETNCGGCAKARRDADKLEAQAIKDAETERKRKERERTKAAQAERAAEAERVKAELDANPDAAEDAKRRALEAAKRKGES